MPDNVAEEIEYEDAKIACFGLMDPCDWAVDLQSRLSAAAGKLEAARRHYDDPAKDIDDSTEAHAAAAVRDAIGGYFAQVFTMFHSMPVMHETPQALDALRFIIAAMADINRGSAPAWLAVPATKRHPKPLADEADWVPVIAALELYMVLNGNKNVDAAAKMVQSRTGRKIGTIKDWHYKLYRSPDEARHTAKQAIHAELDQLRAVLLVTPNEDRTAVIRKQIDLLLS